MIPIQLASNLLVISCIVVIAVTCSVLSVTSADDAISKTEKNRDTSVKQCFSFGSDAILNRTNDYLNLLSRSLGNILTKHFAVHRQLNEVLLSNMLAGNDDELASWDYLWSKRSLVTNLYKAYHKDGVTAIGYINYDSALLMVIQEGEDFDGGALAHDALISSQGIQYFPPGTPSANRTRWGTVERYTGNYINTTAQYAPCVEWKHNPGVPMATCWGDPDTNGAYTLRLLGRSVPPGVENIIFSPIIPLKPFIAIVAFGTYYNSRGEFMGVTYVASDIKQVSQFLQGLKIPGKGRIYCIAKEGNWLGFPVDLHMTGTSHGIAGIGTVELAKTLPATNASDPIIRETATYIEAVYPNKYRELVDNGTVEIDIPVGEDDKNETFFLSVNTFKNDYQINWYVTTTLDKNYILGDIEKERASTESNIKQDSKGVSDDLSKSRFILIITIVLISGLLLLVGFFAITAVVKPILILKKEMASIAVMRLEEVDEHRRLSKLTEVGEMQISFFQMISNLKEYRNYMPKSVLIETESDDVETDNHTALTFQSALSSATSKTSNTSTSVVPNFRAVLKSRRVSLAVTNAIAFSESNISDHREYLTKALECCTANGGIPDSFSGDRFIIMFNGPRTCGNHAVQAVITCRSIIATSPYTISSSVATGTARCGNMGCEGLKRYSVIGSVFSVAMALERANRILKTNLVCCPLAQRDIANEFYTRIEDQLLYPKYKRSDTLVVHSVISEKKVIAEEWMYQLESSEASHPTKLHNEIMKLYLAESYEEALEKISDNLDLGDLRLKIENARESKTNIIQTVMTQLL